MAQLLKRTIPFTQVANQILNDKNLSWKAKGLFAYLFSKPDGWDFAAKRIATDSLDGSKSTYAGLKELEDAGYLLRMKQGNGRVYHFLKHGDFPELPDLPPSPENRDMAMDPGAEKGKQPKRQTAKTGTISNIDSESNKDKKEISTKVLGPKGPDTRISSLLDFLKEKIGGSLDGTQQDNRRYCYLLLNRFTKDFPARDPVDLVRGLISGAVSDDFHAKNTASFKYLYYNAQKIILSVTKRKNTNIIGL